METNHLIEESNSSWYAPKLGRNEKCPCKSGRKYKKCCMINDSESFVAATVDKAKEDVAMEIIFELISRMFEKGLDMQLIHEITKCPVEILNDMKAQFNTVQKI